MSTAAPSARIRLGLSSRADNVVLVRQALSGLADAVGLNDGDLNDIRTAVTEACNNAAAHAYGDGAGPLDVDLLVRNTTMTVTVRDWGIGMPLADRSPGGFPSDVDGDLGGIGMPTINALSSAQWIEPADGGTRVRMTFSDIPLMLNATGSEDGWHKPLARHQDPPDEAIEVGMAPVSIARRVLPRLLRVMATRAHFTVDRHAAIQRIVTMLLSPDTCAWVSWGIQARLVNEPNSVVLTIGPVPDEQVSKLILEARSIEPMLQITAEDADPGQQRLVLRL